MWLADSYDGQQSVLIIHGNDTSFPVVGHHHLSVGWRHFSQYLQQSVLTSTGIPFPCGRTSSVYEVMLPKSVACCVVHLILVTKCCVLVGLFWCVTASSWDRRLLDLLVILLCITPLEKEIQILLQILLLFQPKNIRKGPDEVHCLLCVCLGQILLERPDPHMAKMSKDTGQCEPKARAYPCLRLVISLARECSNHCGTIIFWMCDVLWFLWLEEILKMRKTLNSQNTYHLEVETPKRHEWLITKF